MLEIGSRWIANKFICVLIKDYFLKFLLLAFAVVASDILLARVATSTSTPNKHHNILYINKLHFIHNNINLFIKLILVIL